MAESPALSALLEAASLPLKDWTSRYPDLQPMGYLCSYVPEELIHAAGFTPVRLRANAAPLQRVDAHLQSYTCALCRSTLNQALGGDFDALVGVVFAHTCDAMQALADLWRLNTHGSRFVDVVMQPVSLGSQAARPYLVAELERFRERLAALAGRTVPDDSLQASIALFDETRRLIQSLQLQRNRLSAPHFFAVLDAAQSMPREEFNCLLTALLATLGGAPTRPEGLRLFLVGAVLDEPQILELSEDLGALIVGDDLCSGSRHFHDQVDTGLDPIEALAEYYLRRPPCPTKLHPMHDPARYLLNLVRQHRAQGVVFALEKFCEPHAFDYSLTVPTLDRSGVPHLLLEMDHTPSLEALRTRLQAFVETL